MLKINKIILSLLGLSCIVLVALSKNYIELKQKYMSLEKDYEISHVKLANINDKCGTFIDIENKFRQFMGDMSVAGSEFMQSSQDLKEKLIEALTADENTENK